MWKKGYREEHHYEEYRPRWKIWYAGYDERKHGYHEQAAWWRKYIEEECARKAAEIWQHKIAAAEKAAAAKKAAAREKAATVEKTAAEGKTAGFRSWS